MGDGEDRRALFHSFPKTLGVREEGGIRGLGNLYGLFGQSFRWIVNSCLTGGILVMLEGNHPPVVNNQSILPTGPISSMTSAIWPGEWI